MPGLQSPARCRPTPRQRRRGTSEFPTGTLHDWVSGRSDPSGGRPRPLVSMVEPSQHLLSFENMLELHVLAALRHVHGVRMRVIGNALDYLQSRLGVARPLIDEQMRTDGKTILVHRLDQLIDAGHDGQTSMLELLDMHLDRIERNPAGIATRFFLFTRKSPQDRHAAERQPRRHRHRSSRRVRAGRDRRDAGLDRGSGRPLQGRGFHHGPGSRLWGERRRKSRKRSDASSTSRQPEPFS